MTTFYKKVGRKYVPVSEYDSELRDAYPYGSHLIHNQAGVQTTRYCVDPALAPMIAAGITAEEAITKIIMDHLSYQPETAPITPEQQEAWENMKTVWGADLCRLRSGSIMEAVRAGVEAMVNEANELLENPALQNSYNNFILLSKLSKGN